MREAVQTDIGSFDLLWWVEHWAAHDRDHTVQLQRTLGR